MFVRFKDPAFLTNADHRKEWKTLIRGFETELQLRHHPLKTFDPLAEYLDPRTGGSIGSLGRLLTGTAIDLMQNKAKVEVLDRANLLDAPAGHSITGVDGCASCQ